MKDTEIARETADLDRIGVVNAALARPGRAATYLEIGVWNGDSFWPARARRKLGVDIGFNTRRLRAMSTLGPLRAAAGLTTGTLLFQMPSDRFFATQRRLLARHPPDVALVDGLHTAEQAYRDVTNCIDYMGPGGIVVMHDCSPRSAVAALPDYGEAARQPSFTGAWNGDVWKAVLRLRATRPDLRVVVIDADHGIGLVSRGRPDRPPAVAEADIDRLTWADLDADRTQLLDLRPASALAELLRTA